MATSLHQSGSIVVGYFAQSHAAHRAINALVDQGFSPNEIGAAFHVGADGSARSNETTRQPDVGGSLREELGTTLQHSTAHSSTTFGAASDTTAVQPAALGGGVGTPFVGAGKPGPISGSSLAHTGLPSELKSELPHDADFASGSQTASQSPAYATYNPEPTHTLYAPDHDQKAHENEGWLDKLKHVFSSSHTDAAKADYDRAEASIPKAHVTEESQAFGTGEGHLHLSAASSGLRYSQPAFENSFSGYGVEPAHARHLSQQLGQGGAVITVHATTRAIEAERILEAHGGQVRFAGGGADDTLSSDGQVEVFGTVGRDYPGYIR